MDEEFDKDDGDFGEEKLPKGMHVDDGDSTEFDEEESSVADDSDDDDEY
jgi:hypothetical protein